MTTRAWLFLIHRIPARPLYLRARIRARIHDAGAAPLKKAVYALPLGEGALDRLSAVAAEIRQCGGDAFLCEARFTAQDDERALEDVFREQSRQRYARLVEVADALERRHDVGKIAESAFRSAQARLVQELAAAQRLDFFGADGKSQATRRVSALARRLPHVEPRRAAAERSPWRGRRWVTRRGILVDRIACAWFIRRFLDPSARFRFAAPPHALHPGETGFDMPGGEFSHQDGGCSLETLIEKSGIEDRGLERIAEIVHELDLHDGRYQPPEAAGVAQLLAGMVAASPDDATRLERGLTFFDDLYRSLSPAKAAPRMPRLSKSIRPPRARS